MSLSKQEVHELFEFLNEWGKDLASQLDRRRLKGIKGEMTEEVKAVFDKVAMMFKDVDELIVVKMFCQNRGNLKDTQLDIKMYLQNNPQETVRRARPVAQREQESGQKRQQ